MSGMGTNPLGQDQPITQPKPERCHGQPVQTSFQNGESPRESQGDVSPH